MLQQRQCMKQEQPVQQNMLNSTGSLILVRNLMRICISEICYIRNIFPEDIFQQGNFAGISYKKLGSMGGKNKNSQDAQAIASWLQDDVFPAIEKEYVHSVSFCIYSLSGKKKKADKLLESYTIKLKFDRGHSVGLTTTRTHKMRNGHEEKSTSTIGDKELTKKDVIRMIRSLISMTNALEPLPENRMITMKLLFNDSCPDGYCTKYFKEGMHGLPLKFEQDALKIDIGRVSTGYHTVSLKLEAIEETIQSKTIVNNEELPERNETSIVDSYDENGISTKSEKPQHPAVSKSQVSDDSNKTQLTTVGDTQSSSQRKKSSQRKSKQKPVRPPSTTDVLTRIVEMPTTSITELCTMFSNLDRAKAKQMVNVFVQKKVLFENKNEGEFNVHAQDKDFFYDVIQYTHGAKRNSITERGLRNIFKITSDQAQAILLRFTSEKLLERKPGANFLGYSILHSEHSRLLVAKSVAHLKRRAHLSTMTDNVANSLLKLAATDKPVNFAKDQDIQRLRTPSEASTQDSSSSDEGDFNDETLSQPIYEPASQESTIASQSDGGTQTFSRQRKRAFANPITQMNMKKKHRKVALAAMKGSPVW